MLKAYKSGKFISTFGMLLKHRKQQLQIPNGMKQVCERNRCPLLPGQTNCKFHVKTLNGGEKVDFGELVMTCNIHF